MPTIVVALDGTAESEAALEPGLALAAGFAAELLLVRATFHRPPDDEADALRALADKLGYPRTGCVTVYGFSDNGIADLVADLDEPVVCMATRAHSGAAELALGNVAHDILRRLSSPAVLVGPSYRGTTLGEGDGGVLVYCFDGSDPAVALEPLVASWADSLRLRIQLVTVLHRDGEFLGNEPSDDVRHAADACVRRLRTAGVEAEVIELQGLDPARAIVDHAEDVGASLIACGATSTAASKGVAAASRKLIGGTAMRIVHDGPAPVLVVQR